MLHLHRRAGAGLLALCVVSAAAPACAAPTATDLVFFSPYLTKVEPGRTLSYRFTRKTDDKKLAPSFEDDVKLDVMQAGQERSVTVELFSGQRARSVGPMPNMGNPVVLTMLEQDVMEMYKVLGGSHYYIRNRMRDAITDAQAVEPTKVDYDGRSLDGWKITLKPFEKDANRDKFKDFADRSYEITFAEGVPGGLYRIVTVTPRLEGEGPLLVEELTLTGEGATEAKP